MKIKDCLKNCKTEDNDCSEETELKRKHYEDLENFNEKNSELKKELSKFRQEINVAITEIITNPHYEQIPILCSGLSQLVNQGMGRINNHKQKINVQAQELAAKKWQLEAMGIIDG